VPLREGSNRGLAQGDEHVVFDIVEKPVAIPKDYDAHADAVAGAAPSLIIWSTLDRGAFETQAFEFSGGPCCT